MPQVQPPLLFVGELSPEDKERLIAEWGEDVTILSPARALRRAGALAELAWARWQTGDVDDPISLSPIYLG
jgi:tRNA threonylcarbamoyladenosine biosynthesis protein TsaB